MKYLISIIVLCSVALQMQAQTAFTFPSLVVEYDSAIVFRNLKLIPIKRKETLTAADTGIGSSWISLKRAMQQSKVLLRERGDYMVDNINVLQVQNNTGKELVIRSGEIVMGGRQDRVFAKDTVLPPGATIHNLPVFCIEENRWSGREKKLVYGGYTGNGLQRLIDTTQNQTKVWDEIRRLLQQNNQQTTGSYAAWKRSKKLVDSSNAYIRYFYTALRSKDSVINGFLVSTGNRVLGCDVFVSPALFYQTLDHLLEKYSIDAITTGSAPASSHAAETAYAAAAFDAATQPAFIKKRGKLFFYKGVLIQLTGF